jgi:hypothetical protein
MAVILSIATELVDNGTDLQITDDTENYGSGTNMAVTDIGSVSIQVEKSDKDGTYTTYGTNTITYAFSSQSELYFVLDSDTSNSYLTLNCPAASYSESLTDVIYTASTVEDGIWRITYKTFHETPTNITAFADYSGTVTGTVSVTSTSHGIETGDYVTIAGTTNYNGTYAATKIDANTYYITATWVADDGTGTSTETAYNQFLVFTNYEDTLEVYDTFRELPNKFAQDEIEYNEDVEHALLLFAFKKACEFAAAVGQTEIIEDLQATLVDLYSE